MPPPGVDRSAEYERLGVTPTPDDGARLSKRAPWDESTRPHRPTSDGQTGYPESGPQVGQHLIDVHDMLRRELSELRSLLADVRDGALSAADARAALNEMAMRQNDWTLGPSAPATAAPSRSITGSRTRRVFPHLASSDPRLEPVIGRLQRSTS